MVYEIKCSQCGKLMDFGGEEPESPEDLPENITEFQGDYFCRECVKQLIEFGSSDIVERVDRVEEQLERVRDELGMEKHAGSE